MLSASARCTHLRGNSAKLSTPYLDSEMPTMSQEQPNNPLHGLTLEKILVRLQEHYGWEGLDAEIPINCFYNNPSIKSSLKFLRRTQWARDKVEALYIETFCQ